MDFITTESSSVNNGAVVPYTSGSSSTYGRAGWLKEEGPSKQAPDARTS